MALVYSILLLYLLMEFNLLKKKLKKKWKKNVDMPGNINALIYFIWHMEKNWLWAFFSILAV